MRGKCFFLNKLDSQEKQPYKKEKINCLKPSSSMLVIKFCLFYIEVGYTSLIGSP